jgi:hypothetical protein
MLNPHPLPRTADAQNPGLSLLESCVRTKASAEKCLAPECPCAEPGLNAPVRSAPYSCAPLTRQSPWYLAAVPARRLGHLHVNRCQRLALQPAILAEWRRHLRKATVRRPRSFLPLQQWNSLTSHQCDRPPPRLSLFLLPKPAPAPAQCPPPHEASRPHCQPARRWQVEQSSDAQRRSSA